MPNLLKGSQAVALPLFAGLSVNLPANNVPPGISPDCSDVDFLPQEVFTRAALNKLYTTSLPYPILYNTTYNRTSDERYNLFLDNQGNVYIEDVINTPDQYVLLMAGLVTPGDYINVITADPGGSGLVRAWFTSFSGQANGLSPGGSDIPIYYDGVNLTRVTQDGPAGNILISEQVANIAINYITQPALIGAAANAAPLTLGTTTINFYQNVTGVYTGSGAQTNPNPFLNGTSLVFNQPSSNWPVINYYGPSTQNNGHSSPVTQQEQDNFGNWTSDTPFPETTIGGSTGYGFDMNIQSNFIVANPGNITLYFQVDSSWILFIGNGATYQFGPQEGVANSQYGYQYIASRLQNSSYPGQLDSVVVNFPTAGAYPFEIGWGHQSSTIQAGFVASYANGNVATIQTQNVSYTQIGNDILPFASGSGVTISEQGNEATVTLPTQHPFGVNDYALVQNFSVPQYNGLQQVTSVPDKTTFTFESDYAGLAVGVGGTIAPVTATCYANVAHGLILNDLITISNNTQNLYCTSYSQTIGNVTTVNDALWSVSGIIDPYTFQFATNQNCGVIGYGGQIGGGGLIDPGLHQVCCSFLLDDGSITAPGPVSQWNSTGYKKFTAYNLPFGPPNTKGRILNFTGSGGASFFNIPTTPIGQQNLFGGQTSQVPIGTSTYINDNTSQSVLLDFADETLFTGLAIDITGNNLFDQVTLGPSIGCISYADRMFWWGEVNKIQNFLNMGFNGGYNILYQPLGWTLYDAPNSTLAYDNLQGLSYCVTGNSTVQQQGMISQSAYQDSFFVPIIEPNQLYRVRANFQPTVFQYGNTTIQSWNYHYFDSQNFTQKIDINQWSKVDPTGNISISGIFGLDFHNGNSISDSSYYQYNYPLSIPTSATNGFAITTGNTTTNSISYAPSPNLFDASSRIVLTASQPILTNIYTNILRGWPNISTANINEFTLNFTEAVTNTFTEGVAPSSYSNLAISYDGGVTYPQTIFSTSGPTSGNISVSIANLSTTCTNLNDISLRAYSRITGYLQYGYTSGDATNFIGISNISGMVKSGNTVYTTNYETANITITASKFTSNSSGNLITLYTQNANGNAQINTGNVFCGINVQPDYANANIKLYLVEGNTTKYITSMPQSQYFSAYISATPSNSNVIIGATVTSTNISSSANILVSDSVVNGNTYNLVVADNYNLSGVVGTCAISNWPVDISTTVPQVLPTALTANALVTGTFYAQLYSPSQGVLSQATVSLQNAPFTGEFLEGVFNRSTGATIPSDLQLRYFCENIPQGEIIAINDSMIIPDDDPVNETQLRASYVANPTAYDDVTGKITISVPGEKIVTCFKQRDLLYIATDHHLFQTQDNGSTEPSGWTVSQLTNNSVGALSPFGVGYGRNNAFLLDKSGVFNVTGNAPLLVSEEILPIWLTINWDYAHISWIYNDLQNRKTYIGIPVNGSTIVNQVILMNTRGLDPEYDIAEPIHVSTFSGKLLASDKTLKFALMSPSLNYCSGLNVSESASLQRTTFCGNFGNMYWLNPNKYTDDDYGPIGSYYTTYFFLSPEQEQQLQLDGRKLWTYLQGSFTGVGNLQITPLLGNLNNPGLPLSQRTLTANCNNDLEWNINQKNQRIAFIIEPLPNANVTGSTTDAAFNMTRFTAWLQVEPMGTIRGV